jgi:hypothetical protein
MGPRLPPWRRPGGRTSCWRCKASGEGAGARQRETICLPETHQPVGTVSTVSQHWGRGISEDGGWRAEGQGSGLWGGGIGGGGGTPPSDARSGI